MAWGFQRISPTIGAVVSGVDLAKPLGNATFDALYDAFNRYSVLRLPDNI